MPAVLNGREERGLPIPGDKHTSVEGQMPCLSNWADSNPTPESDLQIRYARHIRSNLERS